MTSFTSSVETSLSPEGDGAHAPRSPISFGDWVDVLGDLDSFSKSSQSLVHVQAERDTKDYIIVVDEKTTNDSDASDACVPKRKRAKQDTTKRFPCTFEDCDAGKCAMSPSSSATDLSH